MTCRSPSTLMPWRRCCLTLCAACRRTRHRRDLPLRRSQRITDIASALAAGNKKAPQVLLLFTERPLTRRLSFAHAFDGTNEVALHAGSQVLVNDLFLSAIRSITDYDSCICFSAAP